MKRLLTAIFTLALIGIVFSSCKKDEAMPINYISLDGSFTVGEKTYSNPTFDLGEPLDNIAFYYSTLKVPANNAIRIMPVGNNIDLGDGFLAYYTFTFNTAEVGSTQMVGFFQVYSPDEVYNFSLYTDSSTAKITKVDAVGGYIEGNFEGLFYLDKKVVAPYYLKGKFKVKHTDGSGDM